MTVEEFQEKRARRWHLRPEFALTTEKEVFEFIRDVGAASLSPGKKLLFPSLIHAVDGSSGCRHPQRGTNSPYAELIEKFLCRYFESRRIFQVNLFQSTPGVASREWMILLFALLGERHFGRRRRRYSVRPTFSRFGLAVLRIIEENHPISKKHLALALNVWKNASHRNLENALQKLWTALKILRIGYTPREGTLWDIPTHWDSSLPNDAAAVSRERAAAELIGKYIEMAVATNRKCISKAFSGILTPTEISETLHYLLLKGSVVIDKELVLGGKKALMAGPHR
jgi:hypothetical protein